MRRKVVFLSGSRVADVAPVLMYVRHTLRASQHLRLALKQKSTLPEGKVIL